MRCIHIVLKKKHLIFLFLVNVFTFRLCNKRLRGLLLCLERVFVSTNKERLSEEGERIVQTCENESFQASPHLASVIVSCICMTFSSRGQDVLPYLEGNAQ